ncbi:HlyD family efflux transporter periplasmic adaptor subunit [Streptomyces sp. NPDC086010]|uniref:HlyD family efflux transporter periplasmic adaptor subunit n=1 Tax=Streptomyces sp. NPDC086010 TaxID=3365745 RepID=UPI0037D8C503
MDFPIQLARPRSLLAFAVVAALVITGAVWSATGSVGRQVSAQGILTHAEGSIYLQSTYEGQITGVFVGTGATFPRDTPLFTIQDGARQFTIRSNTGGRIVNMLSKVGQVVTRGTQLAVIERIDEQSDPLVAMLYLPQTSAGLIHQDSLVDLTVSSAPSSQFGVLRGKVQSISQFPETHQQIADFLGDEQLAKRFAAQGQPIGIVVRLLTDRTASGFTWSTHEGPPFQIDSRTLVSAAIHLAPVRPVDWVVS